MNTENTPPDDSSQADNSKKQSRTRKSRRQRFGIPAGRLCRLNDALEALGISVNAAPKLIAAGLSVSTLGGRAFLVVTDNLIRFANEHPEVIETESPSTPKGRGQ